MRNVSTEHNIYTEKFQKLQTSSSCNACRPYRTLQLFGRDTVQVKLWLAASKINLGPNIIKSFIFCAKNVNVKKIVKIWALFHTFLKALMVYCVTEFQVPSFLHAGVLFSYTAVGKNDYQTYTRPNKPSINGVKENLFPSVFLKSGEREAVTQKKFYIHIHKTTNLNISSLQINTVLLYWLKQCIQKLSDS